MCDRARGLLFASSDTFGVGGHRRILAQASDLGRSVVHR